MVGKGHSRDRSHEVGYGTGKDIGGRAWHGILDSRGWTRLGRFHFAAAFAFVFAFALASAANFRCFLFSVALSSDSLLLV